MIAALDAHAYDSLTGNPAGNGKSSEMIDANGNFMSLQRTAFAVAGTRRLPLWHAGAASLAGARSSRSIEAHDPGGGPGR